MWGWNDRSRDEGQGSGAAYARAVANTRGMVQSAAVRRVLAPHGLDVCDVTWEDTARYAGSSVGPNISDMTIQVRHRGEAVCMPVIRPPNFRDRTADVRLDRFWLRVGNERGGPLHTISLRDYLGDLRAWLTNPGSWPGPASSLLAERDTHVLASAQACFLPVPPQGVARFDPVLFNYQSCRGAPAVLAILATREGTSATIIDNVRDGLAAGSVRGQRLFFNDAGARASLTGERLSDFEVNEGRTGPVGGDAGLNLVMLIQVPLVQARVAPPQSFGGMMRCRRSGPSSDVEAAVIGHGEAEGPFTEIDGVAIRRDPRFPIRVTVQFYQATSNGVLDRTDADAIGRAIERVYTDADAVGSLVLDGRTGRSTEPEPSVGTREPPGWWTAFWIRHEQNTGIAAHHTRQRLAAMFGPDWGPMSEAELAEVVRRIR